MLIWCFFNYRILKMSQFLRLVFILTSVLHLSSAEKLSRNHRTKRLAEFPTVNSSSVIEKANLSILDFTDNVNQIFVETNNDREELIAHFERIERQLNGLKDDIESIHREIKTLGVTAGYSVHEVEIKYCLSTFRKYLEHTDDEHARDVFYKQAVILPKHLEALIDGLLGQNAFNVDIMVALRDAIQCHGRKLHQKINAMMGIVQTGLWVYVKYNQMRNISDLSRSSFKKSISESFNKLSQRLQGEVHKCRTNERSIKEEMRRVIESKSASNRKEVAETLFDFLVDKYDTRKWIVVILPQTGSKNQIYSAQSGGFHTASANGTFAAAISLEQTLSPEISTQIDAHLKKFEFPMETFSNMNRFPIRLGYSLRPKKEAHDVHKHLVRHLAPLRTNSQLIIESLVVETPCTPSMEKIKDFVSIVASNSTENMQFTNNGTCINHMVLVVPALRPTLITNALTSAPISDSPSSERLDWQCNLNETESDANRSNLLRNEFGQAYLSVQGDSSQEATSIILSSEWKNTTGQRWRFVDNQLKNDFGKCLTAWKEQSWYLYQYDCHSDWAGQKWYRHGLQIVNGFNMCLSYEGKKDGKLMYVVQDLCDSTPPFLWYDWDSVCWEAIITLSAAANESRALRNEFSKSYLSGYKDESWAKHEPWSNQPGQNWEFVNGQLRNGNGKCLTGKGWYVNQVDCMDTASAKTWTYNEKRQIASDDGYCLGVGNTDGFIVYNYCKDDPEYRWWY